jgi:hypothetical protein
MRSLKYAITIALLLLAPSVWAQAWLAPAANERDRDFDRYRNTILMQDEFMSGGTTTTLLGELGWSLPAGTVSRPSTAAANHQGYIRLDTGAGAGTFARFNTGDNIQLSTTYNPTIVWIVKLTQTNTNTGAMVGGSSDFSTITPNNGIYFQKLPADTNWFAVTRSTTETRTDTGVAASTNWVNMRIVASAASVAFYINEVLVATNVATIPSGASANYFSPGLSINNVDAASKTMDIDYFQMTAQVTR